MTHDAQISIDPILNGRFSLAQYIEGYRFSIDPILLSDFVKLKPESRVADFGTGSGIIPILLASRYPETRIVGIEIQDRLAALAVENIQSNHMGHAVTVLKKDFMDLRQADLNGPVDAVVTNPPYRPVHHGRVSPDPEKAIARHEIRMDLKGLIASSSGILRTGGQFCAIYPSWRLAEMIRELAEKKFAAKRLRMIHGYLHTEATLFMIEARKGGKSGLTIEPPLVIYASPNTYTPETEAICGRAHQMEKAGSLFSAGPS